MAIKLLPWGRLLSSKINKIMCPLSPIRIKDETINLLRGVHLRKLLLLPNFLLQLDKPITSVPLLQIMPIYRQDIVPKVLLQRGKAVVCI